MEWAGIWSHVLEVLTAIVLAVAAMLWRQKADTNEVREIKLRLSAMEKEQTLRDQAGLRFVENNTRQIEAIVRDYKEADKEIVSEMNRRFDEQATDLRYIRNSIDQLLGRTRGL